VADSSSLNTKSRFFSLDFLKFLLTICIVCHHFQMDTGTVYQKFPFFNFHGGPFYFGYMVEFFFIISGFCAALGFEKRPPENFKNYFINKCIRIYPMAMISVVFCIPVWFVYRIVFGEFTMGITPGIWRTVNSLLLTFQTGGGYNDLGINNPIWYLCVLLYMYVVFYCVVWASKKLGINKIYGFIFLMFLGVAVLKNGYRIPFFNGQSARGYTAFFLGTILYHLYEKVSHKTLTIASCVVFLLCLVCASLKYHLFFDDVQMIFTFLVWPSVLFIFLSFERICPKLFSVLGGLSFEMYLWHAPFIVLTKTFRQLINPNFFFARWFMLCFVIFMISIGFILYKYAEIPLTKFLKNRLLKKESEVSK